MIVGGIESEVGFTLFVEIIKRYESAIEITTDAVDAATTATAFANGVATGIQQAAAAKARAAPARLRPSRRPRVGRSSLFEADLAKATIPSIDYRFYSHTALLTVSGWENVRRLASLRYAMNGCSRLVSLDLSGFDPSSLKDLFYAFSQCKSLETIYADLAWVLPSGCSGLGTFYNDTKLKGGNGTAYSSSAYGYARMVIDREGQAGYLTAAD